jgi:two-component system cell cycle sensor histidine kinase/response regulator CckA
VNSRTALVVDDDEAVRRLAMITLQRAGWHVLGAYDGNEGCRKFKELAGDIHFVLTDILMPNMNGLKMLEQIRRIKPSVKGILMSGYVDNDLATEANAHGYKLLRKPFTPADLLAEVNLVIGAARLTNDSQ